MKTLFLNVLSSINLICNPIKSGLTRTLTYTYAHIQMQNEISACCHPHRIILLTICKKAIQCLGMTDTELHLKPDQ